MDTPPGEHTVVCSPVVIMHGFHAAACRRMRRPRGVAELSYLYQSPAMVSSLVPALIGLYNDIELTERAGAFYTKFQMRRQIKDVLAYVWTLPPHRYVLSLGVTCRR